MLTLDASPLPVISVHIPKTAGTAFADVLVANFGDAVAFSYGNRHPKTHPLLKEIGRPSGPDDLKRIADAGIRIIHGHFFVRRFRQLGIEPSNVWVWLRDPAERLISEYYFNRGRDDVINPLATALQAENLSLVDYARRKDARNLQHRLLQPYDIDDLGFVGLTEFYDDCLELTGLTVPPAASRTRNATKAKEPVDRKTRAALSRLNFADQMRYGDAVRRLSRERRAFHQESAQKSAKTSKAG